jgi:hypothetical protein
MSARIPSYQEQLNFGFPTNEILELKAEIRELRRAMYAMGRRLPDEGKPIAPPVWSFQLTWYCECHRKSKPLVGMARGTLISTEDASGFIDKDDAWHAAKRLIDDCERLPRWSKHKGQQTFIMQLTCSSGKPEDEVDPWIYTSANHWSQGTWTRGERKMKP